jgi:uncharacterized membrane protein (GlpM family)
VSAFAVLGDSLRPKSFAGLFGAAPSIALATLILTVRSEGIAFAATEARSMIFGAIAFPVYASVVCYVIMRFKLSAAISASTLIILWLAIALGIVAVL